MIRLKSAYWLLWGLLVTSCVIQQHKVIGPAVLPTAHEGLVLRDVGPLPEEPDYNDSTQWFIVDREGDADLFYIISTETGDHMIGEDTCHFADTRDTYLRGRMAHEMHAVDSFYSGRLNYYSPYYRQLSMQSWATEEMALSRLPLALSDCRRSWDYYIGHLNQGRPFILAGFSQGAHAMTDIIRHMPDSIASRMVAAYAIGYKITKEDTMACKHLRPPVNWRNDTVSTPFVLYGRKKNDTLSVSLDPVSRLLLVKGYKDDKPMPIIGVPGNYHHLELKFYHPYIRQNMADRVAAWYRRL